MSDARVRDRIEEGLKSETQRPAAKIASAIEDRPRTSIRREGAIPGTDSAYQRGFERNAAKAFSRSRASVRILTSGDQKVAARVSAAKAGHAKAGRATGMHYAVRVSLALAILACLAAAAVFAVPQVTRIGRVSVHGMRFMNESDVARALLLTGDTNLVNVDIQAMAGRIMADPRVESVEIGRVLPDGLSVRLTERRAVAALLVQDAGETREILVDASGVAFLDANAGGFSADLPVISGIRFEDFRIGQRLPEYLTPLLGDVARIGTAKPGLIAAFSEIRVVKLADREAELLLYPVHAAIPIRMPPSLSEENLSSALLVLDILSGRKDQPKIEEIDFRTGTVTYRTKGGLSG